MRSGIRAIRFVGAIAALIALLAIGPVSGQSFELNHYILDCAGACPRSAGPIVSGAIDATFTGSWYDPAQSGQGLSLEVLPDNRILVFWFTFDPAGTRQTWLVGNGTYSGSVATIDPVNVPTGGRWIPNFDATKIVDNAWGTMTLTFGDADHGKVEFNSVLGYGSGSMNLTRLTRPAGITTTALSATGKPWVVTGNLNVTRAGPTATLLADGKVLVAGGWSHDGTVIEDSAELYDPLTGSWASTGRMTQPRGGHAAIALPDGRVVVVGGFAPGAEGSQSVTYLATAEIYDPAAGRWNATGSLQMARAGFTATLLATGKVLVVGGVDPWDYTLDNPELYDPETGTWSLTGKMKYSRFFHDAVALADGRVLVTGGWGDDILQASLREAEIYDPDSGTWAFTASMHGDRAFHTSTLLASGDVLVAGGEHNGDPPESFSTAEIYSPASGKWTEVGDMKFPRNGHSATLLQNGTVLVAGGGYFDGNFHSGSLSNAELFDPVTGTWADGGSFDKLLASHTATLLQNGNVLITGGEGRPAAPVTAAIYASVPVSAGAGMTGTWYDPAQNGHGLVVEALPGNRMLAAWFAFDPAGTQQSWFLGVGSVSGNTATIAAVDRPTGGRFVPNFDPNKIVNNTWGTLKLTFSDCDHGKVDFASTSGYGTGSMNLTRLTQPAGVTCP